MSTETKKPKAAKRRTSAPSSIELAQNKDGRQRVVIESVYPEIDCGRYPIRRVVGEVVDVQADAFTDSHDAISCAVLYRTVGGDTWQEAPMEALLNDRWQGAFTIEERRDYQYTIFSWVDRFKTWSRDLVKRVDAGQDVAMDLQIGANLVEEAADAASERNGDNQAATLRKHTATLRENRDGAVPLALSNELRTLMASNLPRRFATTYDKELTVLVDRERARFSSWYSIFPRSTAPDSRHGTFKDVENFLPYIAGMGFNVVYLTPIHPIGDKFRKGKNNSIQAEAGDPGSPYAIGSDEGGHDAVHPELGTAEDFRSLVQRTKDHGMEIALDIAFNASPDHPWVKEHPEWFRARPDGTIQYAENPPKKYQDIYPLDFESEDWQGLWNELKSVIEFWVEQGVLIFRVDNPHTKSFPFWEWLIAEIRQQNPDVIFLAEAFTRPRVMHRLAKLGFVQSYTYFTWRTEKWELEEYLTELAQTEVREYYGPNFWPNTHDILTPQFYNGARSTFIARVTLAATMASNYGIYGPAYELMEHIPVQGREEYVDNEKYEIKNWDLDSPNSLRPFITRLNAIRNRNPALQNTNSIRFHRVENDSVANDQLTAYTKHTPDLSNVILTVVNLDPYTTQSGWIGLPLEELGIDPNTPFQVHDLVSDQRFMWSGAFNYIALDPNVMPVHIFRVRRLTRDESGFTYYA